MSEGHRDDPSLSASQFRRLDAACNRFEACWKAGERPRIEDHLGTSRGPERSELLRELLLLDVEYRTRAGRRPPAAEYLARFPQDTELLEEVLGHMPGSGKQAPDPCAELPLRVVLEVVRGPHKGRRFEFIGHDSFIVGRAPCAHFRLPKEDRYFSRVHFMVEVNPPRCRLVDLVSLNGTSINGRRVESADLRHGDLIKGGDTALRVSLLGPGGEVPAVAEPAAAPADVDPTRTFRPAVAQPAGGEAARPGGEEEALVEVPVIAGYEIVGRLGRGGMGVVYRARRNADGALVALKTIRPAYTASEREVQCFLREVQILCTLRHPQIVTFHQMGRVGDLFYFVMDYVPGTDAEKLLQEHGRLGVARAVRLICQVLEALDYAHRQGFVHRDVKPANLLVSGAGAGEVCKLADFGLARVYHDSRMSGLTVLGDVGGTILYMPPEQITNYRDARPPADQYAAAATLYHLISGHPVHDFDDDRIEGRLKKILDEPPVPIARRMPEIPERLAWIIHRALAKEPEKRFPTAAAFREALLPFRGS